MPERIAGDRGALKHDDEISFFNRLIIDLKLIQLGRNWEEEIFNYFDERVTNAFTECANGLAKITNRTGRGHSFAVIRFKVLFAHKLDAFKRRSIRSRMAVLGIPFSTFDGSIWNGSES